MPTVIVFFVMFVAALFGHGGDEVAETPEEMMLKERVAGRIRAADEEEQTLQQQIQAAEQEGDPATVDSLQEQLRDVREENVQEIREERQRLREERRQQREVVQAVEETVPEPIGLDEERPGRGRGPDGPAEVLQSQPDLLGQGSGGDHEGENSNED